MRVIESRKFLARNLIDARNSQQRLRLVDLTGETAKVTAFERETHSTVFIDSTVLLLRKEAYEEGALRSDILAELDRAVTSGSDLYPFVESLREKGVLAYPGLHSSAIIPADLYAR